MPSIPQVDPEDRLLSDEQICRNLRRLAAEEERQGHVFTAKQMRAGATVIEAQARRISEGPRLVPVPELPDAPHTGTEQFVRQAEKNELGVERGVVFKMAIPHGDGTPHKFVAASDFDYIIGKFAQKDAELYDALNGFTSAAEHARELQSQLDEAQRLAAATESVAVRFAGRATAAEYAQEAAEERADASMEYARTQNEALRAARQVIRRIEWPAVVEQIEAALAKNPAVQGTSGEVKRDDAREAVHQVAETEASRPLLSPAVNTLKGDR